MTNNKKDSRLENILVGELRREISELREKNIELTKKRNHLFLELDRYNGIRKQTRVLLISIYTTFYDGADKIAYPASIAPPSKEIDLRGSIEELQDRIPFYDKRILTEKRLVGQSWRRFTSSVCKGFLIGPKLSGKVVVKLIRKSRSRS